MERALETQRLKLLRLLAGWLSVVAWVSVAPFVGELPRWVRAFLASLVIRAEMAAQNLVFVSACLLAREKPGRFVRRGLGPISDVEHGVGCDDVPSTRELLRRMHALLTVLEDLSLYGRRLLQRRVPRRRAVRGGVTRKRMAQRRVGRRSPRFERCLIPRIERPPDRTSPVKLGGSFPSHPMTGGRRGRLWLEPRPENIANTAEDMA